MNENELDLTEGCVFYSEPSQIPETSTPCDTLTPRNTVIPSDRCKEALEKCWNKVQSIANDAIYRANSQMVEKVTKYLNENGVDVDLMSTAVVYAGLSMPDNQKAFQQLASHAKNACTPYVVTLRSRFCPNVTATVHQFTSQLIAEIKSEEGNSVNIVKENSSGINNSSNSIAGESNIGSQRYRTRSGQARASTSTSVASVPTLETDAVYCSMQSFDQWWGGRMGSTGTSRLIAVMLEDTECFDNEVLRQFVAMCTYYSLERNLRIKLVLGFSSATIRGVHGVLGRAHTARMAIRKFWTVDSRSLFDDVIREVFLGIPLRIGARTLSWLSDRFLASDYSLQGFLSALRFVLVDHFWRSKLSFLCVDLGVPRENLKRAMKRLVRSMSDEDVNAVRSLDSVVDYFNSPEVRNAPGFEILENLSRSVIVHWLVSQHEYMIKWGPAFDSFQAAHNFLLGASKTSWRKLLVATYSASIYRSDTAEEMKRRLRYISLQSLSELMKSVHEILKASKLFSEKEEDLKALYKLREKLVEIQAKPATSFSNVGQAANTNEDASSSDTNNAAPAVGKKRPAGYHRWSVAKRRAHALASTVPEKKTQTNSLRENFLKWFFDFLKRHLRPIQGYPLHEALYYDRNADLKRAFAAAPRLAITRALAAPWHYLGRAGISETTKKKSKGKGRAGSSSNSNSGQVESGEGAIKPNDKMHDTCIAFMCLEDEGNRTMPMVEWFTDFEGVVAPGCNSSKDDDRNPISRFIAASMELQHIGFFKTSKRGGSERISKVVENICIT